MSKCLSKTVEILDELMLLYLLKNIVEVFISMTSKMSAISSLHFYSFQQSIICAQRVTHPSITNSTPIGWDPMPWWENLLVFISKINTCYIIWWHYKHLKVCAIGINKTSYKYIRYTWNQCIQSQMAQSHFPTLGRTSNMDSRKRVREIYVI